MKLKELYTEVSDKLNEYTAKQKVNIIDFNIFKYYRKLNEIKDAINNFERRVYEVSRIEDNNRDADEFIASLLSTEREVYMQTFNYFNINIITMIQSKNIDMGTYLYDIDEKLSIINGKLNEITSNDNINKRDRVFVGSLEISKESLLELLEFLSEYDINERENLNNFIDSLDWLGRAYVNQSNYFVFSRRY